jgi:hypothetical protein
MRWFGRGSPTSGALSSEPPILVIHVMKTGGTTIARNLRETYQLDEIYPCSAEDLRYVDGQLDLDHHLSVPYLLSLPPERRKVIRVYIGHFPYVLRHMLGFETRAATLLRDPVERTISLLRQITRTQPWEDEPGERRPLATRSLEEVYEHPFVFEPLVHNHQTKVFSMTPADDPQTYKDVVEIDGARLAGAKANLAEIEVLGLQERFDDFLDDAEASFGWAIVRGARKNVTPEEGALPVDPALRRRIETDNALDLDLYEHAVQLVAERRSRRTSRPRA